MTMWILVSDNSRAKLFSAELRENDWTLAETFEHPEGRQTSSEISPSSPPGRMQQSKAHGARHTAMEPHTSPKEAEAERFARHLGHYLEEATARNQFDSLVVVAPPHFLGILRAALGKQTVRHLRNTVNKDLITLDAKDTRQKLLDAVFPLEKSAP
jgi:protein required for attachment to host cells